MQAVDRPFREFHGVVEEVDHDISWLKVTVLVFGCSTPMRVVKDES